MDAAKSPMIYLSMEYLKINQKTDHLKINLTRAYHEYIIHACVSYVYYTTTTTVARMFSVVNFSICKHVLVERWPVREPGRFKYISDVMCLWATVNNIIRVAHNHRTSTVVFNFRRRPISNRPILRTRPPVWCACGLLWYFREKKTTSGPQSQHLRWSVNMISVQPGRPEHPCWIP